MKEKKLLTKKEIDELVDILTEEEDMLDFCHTLQKYLWAGTIIISFLLLLAVVLGIMVQWTVVASFLIIVGFAGIAKNNVKVSRGCVSLILEVRDKLNLDKLEL